MDNIIASIYNKHRIKRYFYLIVGVLICACSYNIFILPNNIVFGGVSGISIIMHTYLGIKPSIGMLFCSFLLCLVGFVFLDKETVVRSIIGAILLPVMVELTSFLTELVVIKDIDMLTISLFGGVLYGLGLGIVYKYGFTLGGTDFITEIVHKYFKLTMGTSMIIVEGFVVVSGAFAFGIINFLYAVVILYLMTLLVDKVILGISDKKAFYIITSKKKDVSNYVINTLGHTITVFSATGGFLKKRVSVLFTVVPTKEYYKLKEGISYIDPSAFFTVVDAYEVSGGE